LIIFQSKKKGLCFYGFLVQWESSCRESSNDFIVSCVANQQ
jgi:hypothetical protein